MGCEKAFHVSKFEVPRDVRNPTSVNMTNSGETSLNIRTHTSQMGHDQVSGIVQRLLMASHSRYTCSKETSLNLVQGLNSTCLFLMEVWMTEGPRVNFVMREVLFAIYTWILCLSYLHEKQTRRIQSLYLYFIKIVPFWLWNIRFQYTTGRYSEQPPEQPAHTSREQLHGKMDVNFFLMFIAAETLEV